MAPLLSIAYACRRSRGCRGHVHGNKLWDHVGLARTKLAADVGDRVNDVKSIAKGMYFYREKQTISVRYVYLAVENVRRSW